MKAVESPQQDEVDSICSTPPRMDGLATLPLGRGHSRSASGTSAQSLGGAAASRSVSMNSISSNGSSESLLVEQEDIFILTHDVRGFKEALGRLKRIFHPERERGVETMRVAAHERLGEVLQILRSILEKYPPIQSTELLMAAGSLIQQVKSHNYEDEQADPSEFLAAIDVLALAFSNRVSEYLMGDLDSSSQAVSKTRSCENLLSPEADPDLLVKEREFATTSTLTPEEIDSKLMKLPQGVDLALHHAKVWSKYAKDVMTYIEKRAHLEIEHARNLAKLAQTMRPILQEESFLPFQSIYCAALDQDLENCNTCIRTCLLLLSHKFIEPLTARRNEHEKARKQIKELWQREQKKMHEAVSNLRKAKAMYIQRQQEYEKAKDSAIKAESNESTEASKIDKKRKLEGDANQKAGEAESYYKACVKEANERQQALEKVKAEVLQQVRELIYQCDQTMKAVTVGYFQLQHTISAPAPVQFQTLCESSRLYEPGTQYMEFVKRHPVALSRVPNGNFHMHFSFEPYPGESKFDKDRRSNGSVESCDESTHSALESRLSEKSQNQEPIKAWSPAVQTALCSDSDSVSSCHSNKSQDTSPTASPQIPQRRVMTTSSGDELETDHDNNTDSGYGASRRTCISKAAETHAFRKLKTPSRCRECDSYVYFQGMECSECGLACHKKCLETLAIQCGHKRLPRKMTTFGVDLLTHSQEAGKEVPHIVTKCVSEIDRKGYHMKGIYRVSGVKSRVEKLCQSFENGAELVDLTDVHANVIANVLKLYLRQLPEPLLTFRLYPEFIRIAKEYTSQKDGSINVENIIEELRDLVRRLPPVHYNTLAYLMYHLKRISDNASENNMPPSNLGIVFGPTLLRTSEGSASLSSLVDTVHQTRVIEWLITYAHDIFGQPPENMTDQEEPLVTVDPRPLRFPEVEKVILNRSAPCISRFSNIDENVIDVCHDQRTDICHLPGFLETEGEGTHPDAEDLSQSGDDWYGSSVISDDDLPEILLPDDSVFKRSPLIPRRRFAARGMQRGETMGTSVGTQASQISGKEISSRDDDKCVNEPSDSPPQRNASISRLTIQSSSETLDEELCNSEGGEDAKDVSADASHKDNKDAQDTTGVQKSQTVNRIPTSELRRQFFEAPPISPYIVNTQALNGKSTMDSSVQLRTSVSETSSLFHKSSSVTSVPELSSKSETSSSSTLTVTSGEAGPEHPLLSAKKSKGSEDEDSQSGISFLTPSSVTSCFADTSTSPSGRYMSPLSSTLYFGKSTLLRPTSGWLTSTTSPASTSPSRIEDLTRKSPSQSDSEYSTTSSTDTGRSSQTSRSSSSDTFITTKSDDWTTKRPPCNPRMRSESSVDEQSIITADDCTFKKASLVRRTSLQTTSLSTLSSHQFPLTCVRQNAIELPRSPQEQQTVPSTGVVSNLLSSTPGSTYVHTVVYSNMQKSETTSTSGASVSAECCVMHEQSSSTSSSSGIEKLSPNRQPRFV